MSDLSMTALVPTLYLLVVLATDAWVYADARAQTERGTSVVLTFGRLAVDTPAAWVLWCLLLWVVFFPLYLTARGRWR
jgi:hypothetical protein